MKRQDLHRFVLVFSLLLCLAIANAQDKSTFLPSVNYYSPLATNSWYTQGDFTSSKPNASLSQSLDNHQFNIDLLYGKKIGFSFGIRGSYMSNSARLTYSNPEFPFENFLPYQEINFYRKRFTAGPVISYNTKRWHGLIAGGLILTSKSNASLEQDWESKSETVGNASWQYGMYFKDKFYGSESGSVSYLHFELGYNATNAITLGAYARAANIKMENGPRAYSATIVHTYRDESDKTEVEVLDFSLRESKWVAGIFIALQLRSNVPRKE